MTKSARRSVPLWLETIILLVVAIVLALVIKTFFVQAFYIPSGSMKPGLQVDDRIMVQKTSYWFGGEPERGDVVVFEDPGNWLPGTPTGPTNALTKGMAKIGLYPTGGHLVKRVVGTEGDTVTCCDESGRLQVNGEPVDEPYLADQSECNGPGGTPSCNWTAGPVPEGKLFVMGDNRAASADSSVRICHPDDIECDETDAFVDADLVVGKVFVLLWPVKHFDWMTQPDAFDDVPAPDQDS